MMRKTVKIVLTAFRVGIIVTKKWGMS